MDQDAKKQDEPDPRNTLKHLLQPDPTSDVDSKSKPVKLEPDTSVQQQHDMPPTSNPTVNSKSDGPMYTATTTTTRRNANGSVSSVYSGNKIRHLKKEDGVPLWRKDIQYDFLQFVFNDDEKVFHKISDGSFGNTFADIYLDAMAQSSKCSKILKDKLLSERPAALNMAMVCLLVNVGRMNTTLNCKSLHVYNRRDYIKPKRINPNSSPVFPEMRAQLRTYHSIPSLQAHQDPNAYKQLQDAPRLKSILKGATEDTEQPSTLDHIKTAPIPRTNPVNLIFLLAQHAPKVSEMHFDVPRDFFDLVMKSSLSSKSRATAFLWLMWWYLESDFSEKDALKNPYGPGRKSRPDDPEELPIKCPQFELLSEEQEEAENVDTQLEYEFGMAKKEERRAILAAEMAPVLTGAKRSGKRAGAGNSYTNNPVFQVASEDGGISSPSRDPNSPAPPPPPRGGYKSKPLNASIKHDYGSDTDRTRSASPPGHGGEMGIFKPTTGGMRITSMLNEDAAATTADGAPSGKPKGPGRGNWRRQHRDGVHHTPKSFAARQKAAAAAAASAAAQHDALETASAASGGDVGAPTAGAPVAGPHGFYLPLNGADVVPKRSRPLTHHQIAVENFRRQKVRFLLWRGWASQQARAREVRGAAPGPWVRAWARAGAADDDGCLLDSEDEGGHARASDGGGGGASSGGGDAPRAGLMAGVAAAPWEDEDFGEFSGALASALRKARRRLQRWEKGERVVRRRRKVRAADDDDDDDGHASGGPKREEGAPRGDAASPLAGHIEDDADGEGEGEGEEVDEVLGDAEEEQDAMDEDDNETVDAMDGQDEVMVGA